MNAAIAASSFTTYAIESAAVTFAVNTIYEVTDGTAVSGAMVACCAAARVAINAATYAIDYATRDAADAATRDA